MKIFKKGFCFVKVMLAVVTTVLMLHSGSASAQPCGSDNLSQFFCSIDPSTPIRNGGRVITGAVLQEFNVVITNRTNYTIYYLFDGKRNSVPPKMITTWNVKNIDGMVTIKFDNANRQLVQLGVGNGRYYFDYSNGVLGLWRE